MKHTFYGHTDPGKKHSNNDDFYLLDDTLGLIIVCDGVSGNENPKLASETCARSIRDYINKNYSHVKKYEKDRSLKNRAKIATLLTSALQAANTQIYNLGAKAGSAKGKMATTAEVLLMLPDYAIVAHVGDSRTYMLRNGQAHPLTEDHRMAVDMQKSGEWTKEQALHSPYGNVLTRSIGTDEKVVPDVLQMELMPGDYFLLCTDGLTEYLRANELPDMITRPDLSHVPRQLVEFANTRGGSDNVTVAVARVDVDRPATVAMDILAKSDVVGKVPLFRYMMYEELLQILAIVALDQYGPGDMICKEGDPSDKMFIIAKGAVEICKGQKVIARRAKGDTIGEMGLFDKAPRSASVKSADQTLVLALGRKELLELLRQDSQIAVKFLWAMNQAMNQRIREASLEMSAEKVEKEESTLVDLPFRAGKK